MILSFQVIGLLLVLFVDLAEGSQVLFFHLEYFGCEVLNDVFDFLGFFVPEHFEDVAASFGEFADLLGDLTKCTGDDDLFFLELFGECGLFFFDHGA